MEIVLAFLLFFGGLAAGSMNAEKGDDRPQATTARPPADASDALQGPQVRRPSGPIRCEAHGTLIYRDLTLPIGHPDRPRTEQHGGLEWAQPDD
jgi:hypothetical protein